MSAFRNNEASRVTEVLERQRAGDIDAMLVAARTFWLEPQERPDQPDSAASEVWAAIETAGATTAAVEAGCALIADRRLLRPHAFIDLVEQLDDADRLLELAETVLASRWNAHPYLAAVFLRLVDTKLESQLWDFIRRHRTELGRDNAMWQLVGYILTTSRIGKSDDVESWFCDWELREAPAWIVVAYVGSLLQLPNAQLRELVTLATSARSKTTADATSALFIALELVEALRQERNDDFIAAMPAARSLFDAYAALTVVDQPLVRYANAVKHRYPITREDFSYAPQQAAPLIVMAANAKARPPNWRAALVIRETHAVVAACIKVLPLFLAMLDVAPGDARAVELFRAMTRSMKATRRLGLAPAWDRLVKHRITWWQRLKLAF